MDRTSNEDATITENLIETFHSIETNSEIIRKSSINIILSSKEERSLIFKIELSQIEVFQQKLVKMLHYFWEAA